MEQKSKNLREVSQSIYYRLHGTTSQKTTIFIAVTSQLAAYVGHPTESLLGYLQRHLNWSLFSLRS
jgi:hypothetical protein